MTEKKRPPIGGISQYSTIGGGKHPTPQNFEVPNAQHTGELASEASNVQKFDTPTRQGVKPSSSRKSKVQNSKRLNVQRQQQTAWIPPDLARWLRLQAVMEDREISEIITDALELYKERT